MATQHRIWPISRESVLRSRKHPHRARANPGQVNRRKVPFKAEWGVDVADSQARKAALREGQIWALFATKERAEKFTAARQTEGYDAIVVAATAKEVKRWRSESV